MKATITFACGTSGEAGATATGKKGPRILVRSIPVQEHKTPEKPATEKAGGDSWRPIENRWGLVGPHE